MIAVVQRVQSASVSIDNRIYSSISRGYLIMLGITKTDTQSDTDKLAEKIIHLRIMSDESGKMNKSILDTNGEILVVSQFTLSANLKGGRRPDFFPAMEPKLAEQLYTQFTSQLANHHIPVKTGCFGAHMQIALINDGPVTFIIDSKSI